MPKYLDPHGGEVIYDAVRRAFAEKADGLIFNDVTLLIGPDSTPESVGRQYWEHCQARQVAAGKEKLRASRRRYEIKADVAMKLDIAVAALAGVEYLGTQRRGELALMLTRVRIAVEESL